MEIRYHRIRDLYSYGGKMNLLVQPSVSVTRPPVVGELSSSYRGDQWHTHDVYWQEPHLPHLQ